MTWTLVLVLALNAAISWWNAYVCGRSWEESKAVGGWIRFMVWCAAVQSAVGFSSIFILPTMYLAHAAFPDYFTARYFEATIDLWYLTIIFPILGSGFAITIESWVRAYRERDLASMGTAAWNTFAQIHNTVGAVDDLGAAFKAVSDAFGSLAGDGDADDAKAAIGLAIAIGCVVVALGGGVLVTALIIHRYAGTVPLPGGTSASPTFGPSEPPRAGKPAR